MSPSRPDDLARHAAPLAAVTGATGFIGRHLVVALHRAGFRVRLLLRREPDVPEWRGLPPPEVVAGALDDQAALERLVEGSGVVIHLAGLIKAARRRDFLAVNRDGAAAMARAVERGAPEARFILVSSLAAREPQLSDYAASKRAGEDAVLEILGARATVLRPSVVYGPGDRETLLFFQLASGRLVPLLGSAGARAAMIHVADLVRLIVAMAREPGLGAEGRSASDDRPQGYTWEELLGAAARAVGNPAPRFVRAPAALLRGVAFVGDVAQAFGSSSMIGSQKLRELRHPDWGVAPAERATAPGWSPEFDLERGFADAVAWYRRAGWLAA
ncbi:MAG: NAD-dependent epimerase/dehydratase family protein [Caldimonas sp.]